MQQGTNRVFFMVDLFFAWTYFEVDLAECIESRCFSSLRKPNSDLAVESGSSPTESIRVAPGGAATL